MSGESAVRRVLIGFFGMTRSLDQVIASIESNVFGAFMRAGVAFDCVGHFNCPAFVHSPRSGEHMVPFRKPDLGRLRLLHADIEDQTERTAADAIACVMKIPQRYEEDTEGHMRRNAVYQAYSLSRLDALIAARLDISSYDAVLLLRPDLRYVDPLPVAAIARRLKRKDGQGPLAAALEYVRRGLRPSADILMPGWHKWNGVNDRFAVATPEAARVYMRRYDAVPAFVADSPCFQSELLLQYVIARAGLRVGYINARAERVRSSGATEQRDLDLIKTRSLTWRLRRAVAARLEPAKTRA